MHLLSLILCLFMFLFPAAGTASDIVSIITLPVIEVNPWYVPSNESIRFSLSMSPGWNLGNALDCYDETGTIEPGVNDMVLDSLWSGFPR